VSNTKTKSSLLGRLPGSTAVRARTRDSKTELFARVRGVAQVVEQGDVDELYVCIGMDVSGRGAERKLPAKRTAAMAKEMGECIIDILKQVRCYKLCRRGKYKGIEQMVENAVIENTC
jgi:hypothetical protein